MFKAFKDHQTPQFGFMFGKIKEYINELLVNEHGNFVIQKCLEIYEFQYMKFLIDQIKLDVINSKIKFFSKVSENYSVKITMLP